MGLFDTVLCKYRLPDPEAQALEYQTKSTLSPSLDNYVVTPDGRLLHEEYDTRVEETAESPFGFFLHRENCRWVEVAFRGEFEIHTSLDLPDKMIRWYSYLLWFKENRVADLQRGTSCGQTITPGKTSRASGS